MKPAPTPDDTKDGAASGNPPRKTGALAVAGIVGPALFTAGVVAQQFYRGDSYDPVRQIVSDLTAGPSGWVQQVNFVVVGLLMITFAVGLHRGVRPARPVLAGPALIALNGAGLIVGGITPLRQDGNGSVYDPTGIHTVNGALFFLGIGIVLVVVSRRLRKDPTWHGLATYTLLTGITLLVLWVLLVTLARPDDAPLHAWFGLAQRLALLVWLTCIAILALKLRRQGRTPTMRPRSRSGIVVDRAPRRDDRNCHS